MVQPDSMAADLGGKAMAMVGCWLHASVASRRSGHQRRLPGECPTGLPRPTSSECAYPHNPHPHRPLQLKHECMAQYLRG
jgi:hypothetical protein